jgi:predicted nucleic acid-binding protein
MGRVKPVFDTNILIDYLGGIPLARAELSRFREAYISTVTWIEVMAGSRDHGEEQAIRRFLEDFHCIAVDREVADLSFQIRRQHRVKLPDAIIWDTARHKHALLITRNTKDFPDSEPDIRIPYRL